MAGVVVGPSIRVVFLNLGYIAENFGRQKYSLRTLYPNQYSTHHTIPFPKKAYGMARIRVHCLVKPPCKETGSDGRS